MFFFPNTRRVPSFDSMIEPVVYALHQLGGTASNKEIDAKVIELMGITEEIAAIPHNNTNRTEVSYRLAWARTYLKKYGLIKNVSRGTWTFTDKFNGDPQSVDRSI